MNLGLKKTVFQLISTLIGSLILVGCNQTPLEERHFNDTLLFCHRKPAYIVAAGAKTLYILSGKLQGLSAGTAIMLDKTEFTFPIEEVLTKYPQLKTIETLSAAKAQESEFKKHHSPLYNPNANL